MKKAVSLLLALLMVMTLLQVPAVCAAELEVTVAETVPAETIPTETNPGEQTSAETTPTETIPAEPTAETVPAETEAQETPEETIPEETIPEETIPEETIPEEIIPEEAVPDENDDEVTVIPALEDLAPADIIPADEIPDISPIRGVPLYFQTDYPDHMYGSGTIADNGCGVTCLAMVATYLTDHEYLPDELARYFGGRAENNIDRLEKGAEAMQLAWERLENFDKSMEALKEGKVVIQLMESDSLFTDKQHFIVLTGFNENGRIMVNDPFAPNYEKWDLKRAFQDGFTQGDVCMGFSGAWAFDKSAMPEDPFLYYEEDLGGDPRYPDIQLTKEDRELMARVVWVEAQGECEEGQQAVAEVILNRLASEKFGTTVKSVVYAEGQFRSVPLLEDAEPFQAQYEAIERAIYGPYILPEDVVHFATFRTNDNVWGQIGGHIFCYEN